MSLQLTYKGEVLTFWESDGEWHWQDGDYHNASFAIVKSHIDAFKKKKPRRVPAFYTRWNHDDPYEEVIVTSYAGNGSYYDQGQYWVKNSHNRREKISGSTLYADSPENCVVIEDVRRLTREQKALQTRIKELTTRLTLMTWKEESNEESTGEDHDR